MTLALPPTPDARRGDIVRSAIFRSCGEAVGADFLARATAMDRQLAERTLPFWVDSACQPDRAGYRLGHDAKTGAFDEPGQLLVSQARLLWTFSRARRLGYDGRDYGRAAEHGYTSLSETFRDRGHGGYFWRTRYGKPADTNKLLYGQSFVLYALVEYARAADDSKAIEEALSLFRTLVDHPGADGNSALPVDLAGSDFGPPTPARDSYHGLAACGYRCANTVLHWMEALTELYCQTGDARVRASLVEALDANTRDFYPLDLAAGRYYVPRSSDIPGWPHQMNLSYGHNVEFGWLMIDAQRALGVAPDWTRLESIVVHTLRFGFDHERGGVFNGGLGDAAAHDRRKTWWAQAEMIAALTYLQASGVASRSYAEELRLMLDWYFGPQMDVETASPLAELSEDGTVRDATISGEWQAAYHDLRARWIFIAANSPDVSSNVS